MDAHRIGTPFDSEHDTPTPERRGSRAEASRRSLERRLEGWMSRVDHVLHSIATEERGRRR